VGVLAPPSSRVGEGTTTIVVVAPTERSRRDLRDAAMGRPTPVVVVAVEDLDALTPSFRD
jgi:hypothetical protein